MKNCLKCSVKLCLKSISCPGTTHIQDRNPVYLSICLFGQLVKTKSVLATFPLRFNERFRFEKIFKVAQTLESVQEILEGEDVFIELCQYSDLDQGGNIIASLSLPTKDFLFPRKSLVAKDGFRRELLLARLPPFSHGASLDPKLVFSTRTVILETNLVEHLVEGKKAYNDIPISPIKLASKARKSKSPKPTTTFESLGNVPLSTTCGANRSNAHNRTKSKTAGAALDKPPFRVGIPHVKSSSNTNLPQSKEKSDRKDEPRVAWDSPGNRTLSKAPPILLTYSSSEEEERRQSLEQSDDALQITRRSSPQKPSNTSPKGVPRHSFVAPIRRDLITPQEVQRRVKHLLRKNKSFLDYDVSQDEDSDYSDLEDLSVLNARKTPEKSRGKLLPPYSAPRVSATGRSALQDRYKDIYKRLYEEAMEMDDSSY